MTTYAYSHVGNIRHCAPFLWHRPLHRVVVKIPAASDEHTIKRNGVTQGVIPRALILFPSARASKTTHPINKSSVLPIQGDEHKGRNPQISIDRLDLRLLPGYRTHMKNTFVIVLHSFGRDPVITLLCRFLRGVTSHGQTRKGNDLVSKASRVEHIIGTVTNCSYFCK